MYQGADAPAKTIYVIDCRHKKLDAIYGALTAGDLRNTREPFLQAGIGTASPKINGEYSQPDATNYTVRSYSYVDHDNPRWQSLGFSSNRKNDKYMPRIKYAGGVVAGGIGALLGQKNYDGVVISIEGFNNGDGDEGEKAGAFFINSGDEVTPTSDLVHYQYWSRLQTILRQQGLSNHLIVHVRWSGTYCEYTVESAVLEAATTLSIFWRQDHEALAGAFFNFDYTTAHFVGRNAVFGLLSDIADWTGDSRRLPISIISESTGARAAVSALQRIKEVPIGLRFASGGNNQLALVLAHPALRQVDLNDPMNDGQLGHDPEDIFSGSKAASNLDFHPYSESPLIAEMGVLAGDPAATAARTLLLHSPFDKPGLAFLFAQTYAPRNFLPGGSEAPAPTAMIGRRGLIGPGVNYSASTNPMKIKSIFAGNGTHALGDFWHVDLMGWTLPGEVFKSRNLFEVNVPSTQFPLESHFDTPQAFSSGISGWAHNVGGGLSVKSAIETPPTHVLFMNPGRISNVWSKVVGFIRAGSIPLTGED